MFSENRNELEQRVLKTMQQAVDTNLVAGVNFLVEKDNSEVLYCQAGVADRVSEKLLERDSIFRLYSQSKPVTGVAAMILMERGELDLFQEVKEFLPAYKHLKAVQANGMVADCTRPLTVHHLLNMTSGLPYPDDVTLSGKGAAVIFDEACERLRTDNEMSTRELADRLAEVPLAFEPGTCWQYGTSADVLGAVIEVVSGKRLADFMADEIFKPLGMKDTAFYVPAEKQHRLTKVYETIWRKDGTSDMLRYTGDNLAINNTMDHAPAYAAGGAGLASTLDDYMKFARMLRNGGEYENGRLLSPKTVQYFIGGELLPNQQEYFNNWCGLSGFSYGNLMRVCKRPGQAGMLTGLGEYGWDGWLGMYFANFPKENMTILMGTQKRDSGTFSLTRKLRNIVLSSL